MTPAERAVIDAARAYVAYYWGEDEPGSLVGRALHRAVRALPRPLSEQLAELRPGAVVEHSDRQWLVLANEPTRLEMWLTARAGPLASAVFAYRDITRIISNPEADRG